jgi:Ca2+/Na+ antiporter
MKKHVPDLCAIALFIIVYLMLTFLSGCTTQKNIQKEKTSQKTEIISNENRQTIEKTVTNTTEQAHSTTETTETVDTLVKVILPLSKIDSTFQGSDQYITISIPVKLIRNIKKEEFGTKQEQKTQDKQEDLKQKTTVKQESKSQILDKKVTRNNSWGVVATIIGLLALIALIYWLYRKIKGRMLL